MLTTAFELFVLKRDERNPFISRGVALQSIKGQSLSRFPYHGMKRLGVFLIPRPPSRRATPCINFACTHLYTWLERGYV